MANVKKIIAITIGGLAVLFALQNTASVPVSFLLWEIEAPRAFVLLLTFTFGVVAGLLLAHAMQKDAVRKAKAKTTKE
ncbi:MAG: LapA family protein [Hyphomonadaceae bacterium]|nr:LapA family protein [Hyphomonadaceae bacterium]